MKSAGKSDSNLPPTLIQTWPLVPIQIGQFGPTSTWQAPDTMSENGQELPVATGRFLITYEGDTHAKVLQDWNFKYFDMHHQPTW